MTTTREKKLYELPEVLDIVPMSRAGLYKAAKEGKIPTVKIGRRIFIPAWYIDKITSEPGQQNL
ncbi:helix-turn-helix transcriptional regulator [Sporolituus thermophilus]|uniref:Helix-turn-helix domain-containing protein n=1 Tax=Sporolituus thermophilus DSM 23256 TaxID=1123285 RepID=A0A1G7PLR6_9FIRM|nr:helix-turn-helix domain-containing protein [Sporolituus thermophilus]SDF87352.1 Helix-turn-helix domain-containing protein [Sporolituus thermophilus DSM 23256]